MIKVKNNRQNGSLFHYAHFLCDCLFPEIVNDIYKYDEVIRKKTLEQTIGNFSNIYTDVIMTKNTELLPKEFYELDVDCISYDGRNNYINKECFDKFRDFIFTRYKIDHLSYNLEYPEVILIKRGERISLIDDEYLSKKNNNIKTGKERREIENIDGLEIHLAHKYKDRFQALYFENMPFEKQVLYFNNAKLIICAHGAVMSNMFFCKEGTKIIEITCGCSWPFFTKISQILNLKLLKCGNDYKSIINFLKIHGI